MTFFKRFFSADFRRAVAAEAAGEYHEAARAYALAGEQLKVAEMHLLRAERSPSADGRLGELRAAIRWADGPEAASRAVRRRIARALFNWARASGLISESDRQVVREAAQLFSEANDPAGAGECHELIGDELAAAEAYQRAGDLEKLEAVLAHEETRRKRRQRVSDAFEEYRLRRAGGERDRALEAIRQCAEESGEPDRAGHLRALEELAAQLITGGAVVLKHGPRPTRYVGSFPFVLGREPTCQVVLRDVGVSRAHVEIRRIDERFWLRDLDSANGTTLGAVPLAPGGSLPLEGAGELGLGQHCQIRYREAGAILELEVVRGLDRGLAIVASAKPIRIAGSAELSFVDGRPLLRALAGALDLNGVRVGVAVQLVHGDQVSAHGDPVRIEVL